MSTSCKTFFRRRFSIESAKRIGACYIRVSTDDQTEYSPDSQERLIREYAEKNGIYIPSEYVFRESEGISGRKASKRPEFQRMIGAAKQTPAPFAVILVWKYSRFARNQEESIVYKSMLRKQCGIDVVSISEPLMEGPFGGLIERIIEWMDEFYSIRLSGEVKRGMTERIQHGKPVNAAPFGYQWQDGNFVPVPEDAALVRQIFDRFVNGESYLSIARWLRTVSEKRQWENRTVEYIIRNPAYTGKLRTGINGRDFYGINAQIHSGTHPAIVSEEIFSKAVARADHIKRNRPKNDHSDAAIPRIWTGLLRCSNCGATLASGGKTDSWQCSRYVHGKGCSVSHYTTTPTVSATVIPLIIHDFETGDFMARLDLSRLQTANGDIPALKKQITRLQTRLRRVREAYEAGIDTLAEYKASRESIQAEIAQLQNEIEQPAPELDLEQVKNDFLARNRKYLEIVKDPNESPERKNYALKQFVSYVLFERPTNHYTVYYN